ncbi:MAG: diaminopimelate decarboxylase [Brevundimonas sp.]|uniref:diaminopimelate decarboxylase n=1 Tax=Brevundimonas sp. TaxID=1871086 RepID=UPI00391AB3E6
MNHFDRIDGALHAEAAPLEAIAGAVGTPVYVYSTATLTRHFGLMRDAVAAHRGALGGSSKDGALIAFAVKANSNLSVLATLARLGCGADTVSEGEIRRALAAGIPGERIVFSGVGKTDAELAFAIEAGVRQINIESAVELDRLIGISAAKGAAPEIAIRVNPKIGAGGHARITTGGATDKFGVPAEEAPALYARAAVSPHVTPVGLACHIGSQITTLEPLEAAFRALREMTLALRADGLAVSRLDLGGGLGVPYHGQTDLPAIADYVAMAARVLDGLGVEAAFEPGRLLAANAGVLLSRVIQVNARSDGRTFLVLDAGMNDLMRPALYDAFHDVVPVRARAGEAGPYDLVGPICESTDVFARERMMAPVEAGDLVAFMGAGAYGAVLASEYNSRPLVPEVLVDGDRWAMVRARPTYDEMWAREPKAEWLG